MLLGRGNQKGQRQPYSGRRCDHRYCAVGGCNVCVRHFLPETILSASPQYLRDQIIMTPYKPIPCRLPKATVQKATELYAERIGFAPGSSITDVVDALGGRIVYMDFPLRGQTESIHIRGDNDFQIYLPSETSALRDRFTIAHELGHLLLHYPLVRKEHPDETNPEMGADRYLDDNASEDIRRCEWEANWFAAAFLMPSAAFIEAYNSVTLEEVSRTFLVSTAAATNRAKSLGLIS